jgi:hypothetical protein
VRLQHAIELDQETRRMALEDPDLEPLWSWIKRERIPHCTDSGLLPCHFVGFFVSAQPDERGMTQQAIRGPLSEPDLRD